MEEQHEADCHGAQAIERRLVPETSG